MLDFVHLQSPTWNPLSHTNVVESPKRILPYTYVFFACNGKRHLSERHPAQPLHNHPCAGHAPPPSVIEWVGAWNRSREGCSKGRCGLTCHRIMHGNDMSLPNSWSHGSNTPIHYSLFAVHLAHIGAKAVSWIPPQMRVAIRYMRQICHFGSQGGESEMGLGLDWVCWEGVVGIYMYIHIYIYIFIFIYLYLYWFAYLSLTKYIHISYHTYNLLAN